MAFIKLLLNRCVVQLFNRSILNDIAMSNQLFNLSTNLLVQFEQSTNVKLLNYITDFAMLKFSITWCKKIWRHIYDSISVYPSLLLSLSHPFNILSSLCAYILDATFISHWCNIDATLILDTNVLFISVVEQTFLRKHHKNPNSNEFVSYPLFDIYKC